MTLTVFQRCLVCVCLVCVCLCVVERERERVSGNLWLCVSLMWQLAMVMK